MTNEEGTSSVMSAARKTLAVLVALAGLAIFVGTGRALRGSIILLDKDLFVAPGFSLAVWAVAVLGLFFVAFGVAGAGPNTTARERVFVLAEAPLALAVALFAAFWVNTFRIVGDVGPGNPIDLSGPVPTFLVIFVRPLLFYATTTCLLVGTVLLFARRLRSVG